MSKRRGGEGGRRNWKNRLDSRKGTGKWNTENATINKNM